VNEVLLDRDAELDALDRQLSAIGSGSGRVVVVEGPAGIGKSSLLDAVARSAGAHGVTVVRARGGPFEQDATWGIARQLFDPLRFQPGWSELTAGAAALSQRALDPQAPEPALAGDAVHAAVHGLVWLACNLAERAPALLMVDDVHWADAASLRWLVHLAGRLDELPLGVLCAARAGEPPGAPELLAELLAAAPEPPVRPRPLGPAAVEALVAERLPAGDAAFAHACHAVTAGNPFLLRVLLGQLVAEGITPDAATAEQLSAFGSDQIARNVERQLARLPDRGLAHALAVLGHDASLRHAARLARLDARSAARAADALRAAGLVHGRDRLALAHPLIAAALYANLAPGERALWHADAARLLADERADPERVALHLLRTDPQGDAATVAALRAAAASASARGAPEGAARFLRRALAEPPGTPHTAAAVRLELGLARAAHNETDAPALLREAVEFAASDTQRTDIALRAARALGLAGQFDLAVDLSRRGLEHTSSTPPEDRERLEAELICNAMLQADSVGDARERMPVPRSSRGQLGLWRVNAAFDALLDGRPASDVSELLAPILDGGVLDREPDSLLPTTVTVMLIYNDDLALATSHCAALVELARPKGWLIALVHASFLRAMALTRAGRVRDAHTDARLAFDFKLGNSPLPAVLWALHTLVDILTEADDFDAADAALAAADQLGDPPRGAFGAPVLLQSRARLRLAQHRPDDAHTDLQAAAERWSPFRNRHPAFASWRVDAAEALAALGDTSQARQLALEHSRLAERLGTAGPQAAGLRALAHTVTATQRIELLERAVALTVDAPAQLEHTRALVDLGAALRRANRRADARRSLRQALSTADRHGMRLLARRARSELDAAGARPRRSALTGPDALTPTEHRVATLAAAGHGNPDIAQQLYITRRTVETHLTHAYQKLDITSRHELAPRLAGSEHEDTPLATTTSHALAR
jgi:DNA-binding NarL/FixJ family response regulator